MSVSTQEQTVGELVSDKQPMSVLEALASEVVPTGPNMSNRSTPTAADADDQ